MVLPSSSSKSWSAYSMPLMMPNGLVISCGESSVVSFNVHLTLCLCSVFYVVFTSMVYFAIRRSEIKLLYDWNVILRRECFAGADPRDTGDEKPESYESTNFVHSFFSINLATCINNQLQLSLAPFYNGLSISRWSPQKENQSQESRVRGRW